MLILICLLFCIQYSTAQGSNDKVFVEANYKISYSLNFINDTIAMTQGPEDVYTYLIADDFTYCGYSYLFFQRDSIFAHASSYSQLSKEETATGNPFGRFNGCDLMISRIYKDYQRNKINVMDVISTQWFIYEEDMIPQNWIVLNDTLTITGYQCQKAVCDYRGRTFEAWFTSEIPISEGPWKFFGLPGLIISLFDSRHHYEYTLVGFEKTSEKIDIQSLSNRILKVAPSASGNTKATKIERKEFMRTKFGEKGRMITNFDMAKAGLPNNNPNPRRYGYIELKY